MTPAESLLLCRFAKACCPQQAFDEYTPDAWAELLADLPFDDAKKALTDVVKHQPFVSPSEIRAGVADIRKQRRAAYGPLVPPADLDPDDVAAYRRWLDETRCAVEDGTVKREGPMPELEPVDSHSIAKREDDRRRSIPEAWWNN